MTVRELISKLEEIPNKDGEIKAFFLSHDEVAYDLGFICARTANRSIYKIEIGNICPYDGKELCPDPEEYCNECDWGPETDYGNDEDDN